MNNSWDDMDKLIKVYESCETLDQVNTATKMFMNFKKMYDNDVKNQDRIIIRAWIQALRRIKQNDEF